MRLSNPLVRVVLAVCLFATVPATGASLFGGPPEPGTIPGSFIKCELLGLGASFPFGFAGEQVKITFITGRFRVGATSTEAYVTNFWNEDEGGVYLPVHVGFSLLTRAHKTLAFYNMAPDIYAEVATAFWLTGIVPFVRGSLYAGVEKSAVGIGVEAGVMSLGWGSSDWREHGSFVRSTHPYVALRFKLLTFSIGLKPH